ncbi:MAG: BatD family protein [Sulfurovum sp.]|nr:BatD family protein [Sulfurovum sp.]
MLTLGRLIILTIICNIGLVYAASVKAMVDTIEVVKGNPVTLRIKAIGDDAVFPDIQKVADVPVLSTSTSQSRNLSIVNGSMNTEQSVTKIIQFKPDENMTIPAFTVNIGGKDYQTQAIDITVVTSNTNGLQGDEIFTLQMKANKSKIMMGESFIVTVYFALKEGVQLSQDVQYSAPNLSDFMTVDTSEHNRYKKGNYQVQEIRYVLTPLKEGNFTIAPAQAKIGLPDRSRRDIFGLSYATKWMQAMSNSLKIEVLPVDEESDLIGDFTVDTSIDKNVVKKNKPVNLVLKIEGKGNLEGFDFPKYDIDGVTVYSDEAKIETKVVDGEIYSNYSKSFAFISDNDFTIPSRELSVYNPQTKEKKILEVKGFDIEVEGSQQVATHTQSSTTPTTLKEAKETAPIIKEVEVKSIAWWMLLLSFMLGALVMYAIQFLPKWFKAKEKSYKESDALKILYGHIGESTEVEEMVRKLYAKQNGDKSVQIDKKELKLMLERFR